MKKLISLPIFLLVTVSPAFGAGSSGLEEYESLVLAKISKNLTPVPGAKGASTVLIRLTQDGRPFSCEIKKTSGMQQADDAVCLAVANAGVFPPPPDAAGGAVTVTVSHQAPPLNAQPEKQQDVLPAQLPGDDRAEAGLRDPGQGSAPEAFYSYPLASGQADPNSYLPEAGSSGDAGNVPFITEETQDSLKITREEALKPSDLELVKPTMTAHEYGALIEKNLLSRMPNELRANKHLQMTLDLAVSPSGEMLSCSVLKSSGSRDLDDAVVRILKEPGVIAPTPDGAPRSLLLKLSR